MTAKKPTFTFPKRFLWGAATSAHQVEGGNHNQWTVWELENARARAAQAQYQLEHLSSWQAIKKEATQPRNYVSGELGNHYGQHEADLDLLVQMNMNAYRLSIEWSRIEPTEGAWDAEAIDHYKTLLANAKKRGIEPIVTLFHYTLPVWFAERGGFEKRRNVALFTRFAEKITRELGASVRYVITMHEPEVYATESYWNQQWPPAVRSRLMYWRVLNNLAYAHNKVARALHQESRRYKVSIAKNSWYFYPGDDAWLSRVSAGVAQYFQDDYFLKKVVKQCDFLGVNYYHSQRFYGYRIHNPEQHLSDTGWDMQPADIQYALERLDQKYNLPIVITGNGLADASDTDRQWWITQTLLGMQKAREHGVKLEGYLHWSLLDTFEWGFGRWPRFGLAAVDYKTGQRTLRPSAVWFGKAIKKLRS